VGTPIPHLLFALQLRRPTAGCCWPHLLISQSRIAHGLLSPTPHPVHKSSPHPPSDPPSTQRPPRLYLPSPSPASPLSQSKYRQRSEGSREPCRRRTSSSPHWHVHTASEPSQQPALSSHPQPRRFLETRTTSIHRPALFHKSYANVTQIAGCVGNACAPLHSSSLRLKTHTEDNSHAGRDNLDNRTYRPLSRGALTRCVCQVSPLLPLTVEQRITKHQFGYLKRVC
jgi:hypothetical protein